MFIICTGDRRDAERARIEAHGFFAAESLSSLTLSRDDDGAAFCLRSDGGPQANAFFEWVARQRRAGQLPSCRLVELRCLVDGHVVMVRST